MREGPISVLQKHSSIKVKGEKQPVILFIIHAENWRHVNASRVIFKPTN